MDNNSDIQEKKQSLQEHHLEHLKKTGYVYKGAAMLILLVGVRSVFLASEEGLDIGTMGWMTLAAITIEFFLLWMYANSVTNTHIEEDEDKIEISFDTLPLETAINKMNRSIVENLENLDRTDEVVSAINQIKIDDEISINVGPLNDELDKLTTELTATKWDLHELSLKVVELNNSISAYTDKNISDKVRQEVARVITEAAKSNIG